MSVLDGLTQGRELWIAAGVAALLLAVLFRRALKWGAGLAVRTGVGMAALTAFSQVGGFVGVHLGVNLWNGLMLGVLGVPGCGLLLMLNWVTRG